MNILEEIEKQTEVGNKTEKQRLIVNAAIKLFAEQGFSNTSTKEIAKYAGVSEGMIFKYYGKKDKLLQAIIIPFISEFAPRVSKEAMEDISRESPNSFEEFLRFFLKNRIRFLNDNKLVFRVLIKEIFYRDELRISLVPYFAKYVLPIFDTVINNSKEKGELADKSTEDIMKVILTVIPSFFISRLLFSDNYEIEDHEIEFMIDFIMHGIAKRKETIV